MKVAAKGFGETGAVEYLTEGLLLKVPYMKDIVKYFVTRGYRRNVDIRAAPYDWRLAPGEMH